VILLNNEALTNERQFQKRENGGLRARKMFGKGLQLGSVRVFSGVKIGLQVVC
jgi:hypothetical protein